MYCKYKNFSKIKIYKSTVILQVEHGASQVTQSKFFLKKSGGHEIEHEFYSDVYKYPAEQEVHLLELYKQLVHPVSQA